MGIDIRNFDPCASCVRQDRNPDWGEEGSSLAGDYLMFSAADVARDDAGITAEIEQGTASFINRAWPESESGRSARAAIGAVGFCGRAIGKGICEAWRYDSDRHEVVSNTEIPDLVPAYDAAADLGVDVEDYLEG